MPDALEDAPFDTVHALISDLLEGEGDDTESCHAASRHVFLLHSCADCSLLWPSGRDK